MEQPGRRKDVLAPLARLVRWLEGPLTVRDALRPAEVIVVAGARIREDGTLSRSAAERVRAAADLYRAGWAPLLLLTGGAPDGRHVEAQQMAREAERLGVPPGSLLLESHSTNTWENADFSAVVLRRRRLTHAIVVTHAFHTRRIKRAFLRRGILAQAYPLSGSWMDLGGRDALEQLVREYVALGIDLTGGRR